MPIEVRRFGVGHRRPDGPPGTTGIAGQVIESGSGGIIAELAFERRARITPHTNPNWTYFLVIEGGGWVGVGDERTRVQAGEAVVWPPDVIHAAWTDGAPMRAIVVEFASPPELLASGIIEGTVQAIGPGGVPPKQPSKGEGRLAPRPVTRIQTADPDAEEGEPL
ncbi:MAG TPA: cupin domain-containing protein [Candidatus Limnocylindrales bacterium]|nr:cupin domain-containing protein [Candidatus Limnocylindrales bacterium]